LEEQGAFCLIDANPDMVINEHEEATTKRKTCKNSQIVQGIGIESSVNAISLCFRWYVRINKSSDWCIVWCAVDEAEGFLRTV
jgi:hypothetical protein